jgi:hypothetical protein|tara:strand:- start:1101 stop:1754 length:654 start_codon:yes stop_codon:yes gene_type:complete
MKTNKIRKKRVKRARTRKKQTRRNVKRGGMKKTSSKQINDSPLYLERSSSEELSPKWPSTPRFEDDDLGSPDEDIELITYSPVNRFKPFGLRIYKNIDKKGIISTPNWTLDNGTFDPKNYGRRGIGSFKFINQTRLDISLSHDGGTFGGKVNGTRTASSGATFFEHPLEEGQGGPNKDVMGSRIIKIHPQNIKPFYQFAFNILDSDGPNPLYVLYER